MASVFVTRILAAGSKRTLRISQTPAPEVRRNLAQRFSAGKAVQMAQVPEGRPTYFFRLAFAALILCGAFLFAADPPTPITKSEVYQTIAADLRARGVAGDQLPQLDQVELPVAVPATPGHTLRVTTACWDDNLARVQFRLECREAGQCLPFLAYVRASPGLTRTATGSPCRAATQARREIPRKPVLRAGDRATVVFARGRMRLTAVVTCLERGAEGDVIRVRNQDGQTFRARIANPTLLEAIAP